MAPACWPPPPTVLSRGPDPWRDDFGGPGAARVFESSERIDRTREDAMRLADKIAIVTGAASGMGAATAVLFAREGATVVVADVLADDGGRVVARIKQAGGHAQFQPLDVSSETDW